MGEKNRVRSSAGVDQHSLLTFTKEEALSLDVKLMHGIGYVFFLLYFCIFCLQIVLSIYLH